MPPWKSRAAARFAPGTLNPPGRSLPCACPSLPARSFQPTNPYALKTLKTFRTLRTLRTINHPNLKPRTPEPQNLHNLY
jgi:hypothetical protein